MISALIFECDRSSSNLRKSVYVLSLMRVHASHSIRLTDDEIFTFFVRFLACIHELRFCVCMQAMYSLWRVDRYGGARIDMQVFLATVLHPHAYFDVESHARTRIIFHT